MAGDPARSSAVQGRVAVAHLDDVLRGGGAPTVDDNAFDGIDPFCRVFPKIDADGWSGDIVWHGFQVERGDELEDRKDGFGRERVDAGGLARRDADVGIEWYYRDGAVIRRGDQRTWCTVRVAFLV